MSSVAEFSSSIDSAIGIEPEAAWPIIAELWDTHRLSAQYDLGVICVHMASVGVVYLSYIGGYHA